MLSLLQRTAKHSDGTMEKRSRTGQCWSDRSGMNEKESLREGKEHGRVQLRSHPVGFILRSYDPYILHRHRTNQLRNLSSATHANRQVEGTDSRLADGRNGNERVIWSTERFDKYGEKREMGREEKKLTDWLIFCHHIDIAITIGLPMTRWGRRWWKERWRCGRRRWVDNGARRHNGSRWWSGRSRGSRRIRRCGIINSNG